MSPTDWAVVAAAVAAYGVSASLEVELPNGRRVSPVSAFGLGVAALGAGAYERAPSLLVLASAAIVHLVVARLVRRTLVSTVLHLLGLAFAALVIYETSRIGSLTGVNGSAALVIAVGIGSLVYFAIEVVNLALQREGSFWRAIPEASRAALPLAVVMSSTAGLLILVFPYLQWASFLVLFLPVLATKYEFARFGEARRTYRQTVGSLARLTEGAGYVEAGHHARVAELCLRIGREVGLPEDTVRQLELVALLHDVGSVSMADVSEIPRVNPAVVAASTGRILEETGYLAKYATILRQAVEDEADVPLEAKILRLANRYDTLRGSSEERIRQLSGDVVEDDRRLLDVLRRVTDLG